ncbi:MAG: hypothetical protein ACYC4F_09595 [Armatimonadota bacterium]
MPSTETSIHIEDTAYEIAIPQNAVQVFHEGSGKFTPLVEIFDVAGTVAAALEEGSFHKGIVMEVLSELQDWYRAPTVNAVKILFPDSEPIDSEDARQRVSNVVQVRSDSPDWIKFGVRCFVPGRCEPVLMTLSFPTLYRGFVHKSSGGSSRLWRDVVTQDGTIVRSLANLVILDLLECKGELLRRAEYLSNEELEARWQQRINRITNTLYIGESREESAEVLSEYAACAVRETLRILPSDDILPGESFSHMAGLVSELIEAGEVADPLHTSAGSPCRMFYRPSREHPEDGEPVQLWKHPTSKMVNPGRIGVLAGDIHCLPLAKGPSHRVMVEGFPYYESVFTRDLLGVACDLPGVLGDGFIISEQAAEELSVIIDKWETLTQDELISRRGEGRLDPDTKPVPIELPTGERRWRARMRPYTRRIRVGDKLQSGIMKGVVNRILPEDTMPRVLNPDGTVKPADIILSWRHLGKWGAISEICRAQLAYWCSSENEPLILKHGEITTHKEVQEMVESAGGSSDLTLPVLFPGEFIPERVYSGYFPVGVRGELVERQSRESSIHPEKYQSTSGLLDDVRANLLAPDTVAAKGPRLGYADIFCLMDSFPKMMEWLTGFSNDHKLKEIVNTIEPPSL